MLQMQRRGRTPSPGVTPKGAVFVAVFLFCCVYVSHVNSQTVKVRGIDTSSDKKAIGRGKLDRSTSGWRLV